MDHHLQFIKLNISDPMAFAPFLPGGYRPVNNGGTTTVLGLCEEAGDGQANAVGILEYECFNRFIVIHDLQLTGDAASRGIASEVLSEFGKIAQKSGAVWIDSVAIRKMTEDAPMENTFTEEDGYELLDSHGVYDFSLGSILDGPVGKDRKIAPETVSFGNLSQMELHSFNKALTQAGNAVPVNDRDSSIDKACSFFYVKDGKVLGCMLIANPGEGLDVVSGDSAKETSGGSQDADRSRTLEIRWLYGDGPTMLLAMIKAVCCSVEERYGTDVTLHAAAVGNGIAELIHKLAGGTEAQVGEICHYRKILV